MNKHFSLFSLCLLAALFAESPALAAPSMQEANRFLQDIAFVESGTGPTNALTKLNGFLAKSASSPQVKRHLLARKISLLMKINRYEEARAIFDREFADQPVSPKDALEAYEALNTIRGQGTHPTPEDHCFIDFLERLLKNPRSPRTRPRRRLCMTNMRSCSSPVPATTSQSTITKRPCVFSKRTRIRQRPFSRRLSRPENTVTSRPPQLVSMKLKNSRTSRTS